MHLTRFLGEIQPCMESKDEAEAGASVHRESFNHIKSVAQPRIPSPNHSLIRCVHIASYYHEDTGQAPTLACASGGAAGEVDG